MSASTKKKYCKLLHEITNHHLISPGAGNIIYTYLGVSRTIYILFKAAGPEVGTEEGAAAEIVLTLGQLEQVIIYNIYISTLSILFLTSLLLHIYIYNSISTQDCLGAWCPHRRIPGLILIHAWNPNDMNTLTSDHVKVDIVDNIDT